MTDRAIAALRRAVDKSEPLDPKSRRLNAALDYLARALPEAWGVEQFRMALSMPGETARWQLANASLNAIERQRHPTASDP